MCAFIFINIIYPVFSAQGCAYSSQLGWKGAHLGPCAFRLLLALCHGLDRWCVAHNRLGWSGKPFRGHIAVSLPMHPNIATFPSACLCCAPLPTAHRHVLYWSGLPRLSECAQSGWEVIGNPVLRRKSSFTFRCSWALYRHVIHFGHREIISSNNANAAISPTENCHYQAF